MAANKHKQKARGKPTPDEELSLELIQELGGTKEDLRLIGSLDDEEDVLDLVTNEFEEEPIKKDEIHSFMQQLGIFDHRPDLAEDSKASENLLEAQEEDDTENLTEKAPTDTGQTGKKKKKKEKSKDDNESQSSTSESQPQTERKKKETSKEQEAVSQESKKEKKKKKKENKFKVQHEEVSSTTASGEEELLSHVRAGQQQGRMLVKVADPWLDEQVESAAEQATKSVVQQCEQFAAKLLEDEVALYKTNREKTKKGDSHWMKTVLTSGTLPDKLAALTLLVQESPVHNMAALDSLVNMTKKKGKREAMLAADTLKSVFTSDTSPLTDNRKLIAFDARPLCSLWHRCSGNKDNVDRHLIMWHAEDLLRQKYAQFVKALDVMSYDTLLASKEKALAVIHSLLTSKPEQEDVLLPMLVNKLGDPNPKVASKASYLLLKLVEHHPAMKEVIAGEVERLVYRPNVGQRAQYYAMCFLNQLRLYKLDTTLASQLIRIYFDFFKVYVKKGEVDSKMMAALLTGVNRAYPYARLEREFMLEQMATLYKIVHIVNFNTSVQALMLLYQVVDPSISESDRFFMALYRKMLDPALRTSAKQPQFLNLLYKSMKADIVEKRVKAFIKRLLQSGALVGPNFLCGVLVVISELLKERPGLLMVSQIGKAIVSAALTEDDDEEERFVDLPVPAEFQNESDKVDKETPEDVNSDDDKMDTVTPQDVDCNGDKLDTEVPQNAETAAKSEEDNKPKIHGIPSSWLHSRNMTGKSEQQGYNGYQRNPLHCNAQNECFWVLKALTQHFHPSVSLFASMLVKGESIEYTSDPLQDFTLIRFLERFVYKNAKKKEAGEQKLETVGAALSKRGQSKDNVPVNSEEFLQQEEEAVPEHERYLYRYFSQRAEKKKEEEGDESDAGSVSDTEFDDFLDKYERQVDDGGLDDADFGADFAASVKGKDKGGKKKFGQKDNSSEEDFDDEDDEDDMIGLSDEEVDFGDEEDDELAAEFKHEMEGLGSFDTEDIEEEADEDFSGDELKQMMSTGKRKGSKMKKSDLPEKKIKKSGGLADMFAAADDFADVLEANTGAPAVRGTLDDVYNPDKASAKQIAWEAERDRRFRGRDWKQKKQHGRQKPQGKKPAGRKNKHSGAPRRDKGRKRRK